MISRTLFKALVLGSISTAFCSGEAVAGGKTEPFRLSPFDIAADDCTAPAGFNRNLVFFQDNDRQFMEGVKFGLSQAAQRRGLKFSVELADNDAGKMLNGVDAAVGSKVGAMVVAPVDAVGLSPSLEKAIQHGVYVGTIVPPPAVTILNAPQYLTGERLALAASDYIARELNGRANVVLLTHDSLQFLAPRFKAMRDVLGKLPDVRIVADISPSPVNVEGGYEMMKLILLAHPKIDVILGADTVVVGALKALREAGRASPKQFLGGIDGEPDAVAELKDQHSPYKASVSLASPVFGFALGSFAADWQDGKSVPQAMDILPKLLTAENIAQYEADLEDPASVFADHRRREVYLKMYGNICFETRNEYLNFPWSSDH